MSAQVAPLPVDDGGGADGNTNSNNGGGLFSNGASSSSSTITANKTKTTKQQQQQPHNTQQHVCSRFLKKHPPDLYGQRHVIETDECIVDSLRLLENELRKLLSLPDQQGSSRGKKKQKQCCSSSGIDQARVICPEIFESKEHRLLFLRCEQFNVDLAALRMANYWKRRIELFGNRAFSPLTVASLRDTKDGTSAGGGVEEALSLGFLRLIPDTDDTGRCNVYIDPSVLEGRKYSDDDMVRAAWYTLHSALETHISTQRKGIVFLVYLRYTYVRHFDRSLVRALANSIRGVLPVRVSAIHVFHAPYVFEILFDVVALLLGERLTKRMRMYSGEDDGAIHHRLVEFGIVPNRLPVELGGYLVLDQDRWIAEQRENEGK